MDKISLQYRIIILFIASLLFPYSISAWDGGTQQYNPDSSQSPQSSRQNQGHKYPPEQASPRSNVNPWAIPPRSDYQGPVIMRPWGQVPPRSDSRRNDTSNNDRPAQYPSYNPNPYPVPPRYQNPGQGAPFYPYGQYSPYGGTYGYPSWGRGNNWNPYGGNIGGLPWGGMFP